MRFRLTEEEGGVANLTYLLRNQFTYVMSSTNEAFSSGGDRIRIRGLQKTALAVRVGWLLVHS